MTLLAAIILILIAIPILYYVWMHTARIKSGDADAIVVLGYRCEDDLIDPLLVERLDLVIQLLRKYKFQAVILSGGAVGAKRSEAEIMHHYMIRQGVDPQLLVLERWSRNTVHNLVNSELIMRERGLRSCLIVSNSFHIRRMKYIANFLGMHASFYADRSLHTLARQVKLTWQELRAFRLTLPWLEKVSAMEHRQLMGNLDTLKENK